MSIFKYFNCRPHLEAFMEKGEVMFNPLSYFLSCDEARRDEMEGSNWKSPSEGLIITKVETQEQLIIKGGFASQINADRYFVFCTSTEYSDKLYNKFKSQGCVEIQNLEKFYTLIRSHILHKMVSIKNKAYLTGEVKYYDVAPATRYACPDQIIMSKRMLFSEEKEYRFAFSTDKNGFAVNNLNHSISEDFYPMQTRPIAGKKLSLGNLSRIARIIR